MRKAIKSLLNSTSSRHSPSQIAGGIACGLLVGLLPPSSLLFYASLVLVYCLPVHLLASLATACLVSLTASAFFEPVLAEIGIHSLTHPILAEWWMRLDKVPLVPWLRLHQTVVNGGLMVGLAMWTPIFLFSRYWLALIVADQPQKTAEEDSVHVIFESLRQADSASKRNNAHFSSDRAISENLMSEHVAQSSIPRVDLEIAQASVETEQMNFVENQSQESTSASASLAEASSTDAKVGALAAELSLVQGRIDGPGDTAEIFARATNLVSLVDELIAVLDVQEPVGHFLKPQPSETADFGAEDRVLSERRDTASNPIVQSPKSSSMRLTSSSFVSAHSHEAQADANRGAGFNAQSSEQTRQAPRHEHARSDNGEQTAGGDSTPAQWLELTPEIEMKANPSSIVPISRNEPRANTKTVYSFHGIADSSVALASPDVVGEMDARAVATDHALQALADTHAVISPASYDDAPHQETLRYLLNHLRALRDKV